MPVTGSATSIEEAIRTLCAAADNHDADATTELLAPDIVFHSPLTGQIRFEGKDEVVALLRDIFAVFQDINTSEPLVHDDTGSLCFRAHVRGLEFEAIIRVRFNEHGQIADFKVFACPLPALATLFSVLPPRVSARRRGRLNGAIVTVLSRPLAFAFRTADRLAPKLI